MTTPKLPEILAKCESCPDEGNCHPPEAVAWSAKRGRWLCAECWVEDRDYDEVKDEYERPLVYAKDALDDREDMLRRLIAAATARRMGV